MPVGLGPLSSVLMWTILNLHSFVELSCYICNIFLQILKYRFALLTDIPNASARSIFLFLSLYFFFPHFFHFADNLTVVPLWPFLLLVISHELLIHQVPPLISFWFQLVQLFTGVWDKHTYSLSPAVCHTLEVLFYKAHARPFQGFPHSLFQEEISTFCLYAAHSPFIVSVWPNKHT